MLKRLIGTIGAALLLAGCVESRTSSPGVDKAFGLASEFDVSARDYTIDPPDEIILHCPGRPDLDNQKRKVAQNGTVTFPLLGDVQVAGLTTQDCTKRLRTLVSIYYVDPQFTIEVIDNSKFYYVFGPGANNPSPKVYTGRDTVIQALAEAGFNDRAWPQQVLVTRPRKDGKGEGLTAVVDFKRVIEHGDLSQNYLLEQGDIIDVRKSPLWDWHDRLTVIAGPLGSGASAVGPGQTIVRAGKTGP